MKKYESPLALVCAFENADILTTSGEPDNIGEYPSIWDEIWQD